VLRLWGLHLAPGILGGLLWCNHHGGLPVLCGCGGIPHTIVLTAASFRVCLTVILHPVALQHSPRLDHQHV
jgi:hypothetical protein